MPTSLKSRREPMFNLPLVVIVSIAVMVAIHGARMLLPEEWDDLVLGLFAFTPDRYLATADEGASWPGGIAAEIWSPFTYALLHNDLLHLVSNCAVFAALGNVLGRRTTVTRFLLFCAVTAPLSALGEMVVAFYQSGPVIGVSGVICAMMGALARFAFPAPIVADEEPVPGTDLGDGMSKPQIPSNRLDEESEAARWRRMQRRALPVIAPLLETLRRPKVLQFILGFAVMNLILVVAAPMLVAGGAGVAWMVHVAGFIAGLLLWPRFDQYLLMPEGD